MELTCKGWVTVACLQVIDNVGLGNIRRRSNELQSLNKIVLLRSLVVWKSVNDNVNVEIGLRCRDLVVGRA